MSDVILDHRDRLERLRLEAADRRQRALIDLSSPASTPEERVRVWERLFQLRLPLDPAHPILAQVAQQTALALDQVLEVQRQRQPVVPVQ